jgi:dethiobiotin synthetase
MMRLLITGTDTDIGKTYQTLLLAGAGLLQQKRVAIYKPVQTGIQHLEEGDACWVSQQLQRMGIDTSNLHYHTSYWFATPAAPTVASQHEPDKPKVDIETLRKTAKTLFKEYDWVLVEGAGGAYCPLVGRLFVADLGRICGIPSLVVTHPRLGSINHTLLTVDALFQHGSPTQAIMVNHTQAPQISDLEAQPLYASTLLEQLRQYSGLPVGETHFAPADSLTAEAVLQWWQTHAHLFQ